MQLEEKHQAAIEVKIDEMIEREVRAWGRRMGQPGHRWQERHQAASSKAIGFLTPSCAWVQIVKTVPSRSSRVLILSSSCAPAAGHRAELQLADRGTAAAFPGPQDHELQLRGR